MNRISIALLALLIVSLATTAVCHAQAAKDQLVGTWEYTEPLTQLKIRMVLGADGRGTFDEDPLTWSVAGNTLTLVQDGESERYAIRLDGDRLHASGGDLEQPITFTRIAADANAKEDQPQDRPQAQQQQQQTPAVPGAGTWVYESPNGAFALELKPDGSGAFNGQPLQWKLAQQKLTLDMAGASTTYDAQLSASDLTLAGGDLPQRVTFKLKSAPAQQQAQRQAQPQQGIVGRWNSSEGPIVINADGTGTVNGKPFRYTLQADAIIVMNDEGISRIPYKLDGDRLTITVDGEQGVLTRASAAGAAGAGDNAAGGAVDQTGAAGVYVVTESSVDPNIMMSITQYLILWPDGTVGWAKAEGGATRAQVTDTVERFTSFRNNAQIKGETYGRWESDGQNIVIRWSIWNNLVCRGQLDGQGGLHVEKMGILEEGATLKYEKQ